MEMSKNSHGNRNIFQNPYSIYFSIIMFFVVCVCARGSQSKMKPGKLLAAWAVASRNLPSGGVLQMQIQVAHS
jgi:hypothetical protein